MELHQHQYCLLCLYPHLHHLLQFVGCQLPHHLLCVELHQHHHRLLCMGPHLHHHLQCVGFRLHHLLQSMEHHLLHHCLHLELHLHPLLNHVEHHLHHHLLEFVTLVLLHHLDHQVVPLLPLHPLVPKDQVHLIQGACLQSEDVGLGVQHRPLQPLEDRPLSHFTGAR